MAISDPQIFKRDQPSLLLPNRTAKSPTLHLSIPRMFTVNFFFLGYIKFEGISNHRQVRAFSPRSLPLNSPLPGNRYNLSIWFALKTSCKMIKLKRKDWHLTAVPGSLSPWGVPSDSSYPEVLSTALFFLSFHYIHIYYKGISSV